MFRKLFLSREPTPVKLDSFKAEMQTLTEDVQRGDTILSLQLGRFGWPPLMVQSDGAGGFVAEVAGHPEAGKIVYAPPS